MPVSLPCGVGMEKIICGKVTLFREKCPNCGDFSLSKNSIFYCDFCGLEYKEDKINSTRVLSKTKRKSCPQHIKNRLIHSQQNKCCYCGREFGTLIYKNGKCLKLTAHADHNLPYSYLQNNPDDNWLLSCSICNLWKSSKIFASIEDAVTYLTYKWDKAISKNEIEILM